MNLQTDSEYTIIIQLFKKTIKMSIERVAIKINIQHHVFQIIHLLSIQPSTLVFWIESLRTKSKKCISKSGLVVQLDTFGNMQVNKSNRVRTIDAFSSVLVLILVPVLLTIFCYIPSYTITLLEIGQIRNFISFVTDGRMDRPTEGRTHPLLERRERI